MWSQGQVTVDGLIIDGSTKEKVSNVLVYLKGSTKAIESNSSGNYVLQFLSTQDTVLMAQRLGFKIVEIPITHAKEDVHLNINIEIVPSISELDVVIQSSVSNQPGMIIEDMSEIKLLPSVSGNLETILPHIAMGVSGGTGGELSSQYNVRGGNYDENLVYVNGFQIYRPQLVRSGQQEGLSFPNPDMVRDISFSSGGFAAKYGDKMSSVLDINYKRPDSSAYSAEISLLGATAHAEGSVQLGKSNYKKFRYLLGGRYKSTSYLLNTLDVKGEYLPKYYDVQGYFTYDISEDIQAGLLINYNRANYDFTPVSRSTAFGLIDYTLRLDSEFEGSEKDVFETTMAGLSLTYLPDRKTDPFFVKLLMSAYQSGESENFDIISTYQLNQIETSIGAENQGEIVATIGDGIQHSYARNFLLSNVSNIALKGGQEKVVRQNKQGSASHFLQWGLKSQYEKIEDRLNEWERLDSAGYSLPFNDDEVLLDEVYKLNHELESYRMEAYIMDTYTLRENQKYQWTFEGGLRSSYWSYNKEWNISPRFQIEYHPLKSGRNTVWRLASGLYYQPPFYRELRNMEGEINPDIKSQKSLHVVLGYSKDFTWKKMDAAMNFTSEIYYKKLWDLIPYEVDNVRIRYFGDNLATGHVAGIDFRLNGELVPGAESWINFSFLKVLEKWDGVQHQDLKEGNGNIVDSEYVPRPTDQLVSASIFFQDYLPNNENFKLHLSLNFGSGLPFGTPQDNMILRNPFRYKPYYRVDTGFSVRMWNKEWINEKPNNPFRFFNDAWMSIEVFNLLQVENDASITWIKAINNVQYPVKNRLTSRRVNLKLRFEF
ncbi:carboxypeptidase-like regulatory domain-containing protein [Membranihabitans marinus]